jgi:hypothetical protein
MRSSKPGDEPHSLILRRVRGPSRGEMSVAYAARCDATSLNHRRFSGGLACQSGGPRRLLMYVATVAGEYQRIDACRAQLVELLAVGGDGVGRSTTSRTSSPLKRVTCAARMP